MVIVKAQIVPSIYDALMPTMSSSASNKVALFVDGPNLHATSRLLGFEIDYARLLSVFQNCGTLLRASYYTVTIDNEEFSSIRPLIDWLGYNGYLVITKPAREFVDVSGRRKLKGNMNIEIAIDAMQLAKHVDRIVLFSGDSDFSSLVEAVQRQGVHVTVVSSVLSKPSMVANELRRQADVFIDLAELKSRIQRVQSGGHTTPEAPLCLSSAVPDEA